MGSRLFGVCAAALGAASLALHAQLISNWTLPGMRIFLVVTAAAQIAGGIAMQFPRSGRIGATILFAVYLVIACTFVPEIFAHPAVYASWGDVFYALGLVVGAGASLTPRAEATILLFGLCNISYAIEQVEFFRRTVGLVPTWIPLGGSFWAVATTVAFAVAGLSLLIRYRALLASVLLTVMLAIFGVTIWIPMLIAHPHEVGNWSEGLQTFAIAAAAWAVADALASRPQPAPSPARTN